MALDAALSAASTTFRMGSIWSGWRGKADGLFGDRTGESDCGRPGFSVDYLAVAEWNSPVVGELAAAAAASVRRTGKLPFPATWMAVIFPSATD